MIFFFFFFQFNHIITTISIDRIYTRRRNSEGDDANFGDTFAGHRFGDNKINASKGDNQLTGNGGADKF